MPRVKLSDEERRRRKAESQAKWKAKQRGEKAPRAAKKGPTSWLKKVEAKLDQAEAKLSEEDPLPKGAGEPFADLPPLDLGDAPAAESSSEPATEAGTATADGASAGSTSAPSESSSEPKAEEAFADPKMLAEMIGGAYETVLNLAGQYAVERGFPALGPGLTKFAGKAMKILVLKYGAEMQISDEEGALYIVVGAGAWNGGMAGYAFHQERKKAEEEKTNAQRAAAIQKRDQFTNGAPQPGPKAPEQPREQPRAAAGGVW